MIRSEHVIAAAESVLGMAFYHLGNFAQGRHWLERALESSRATGHRRRVAKTLIQLGLLHRSEGRLTLGRQHLNEALETARVCHSNECLAAGLAAMAHLERLAGNHASALVMAAEALDAAKQPTWTSCEMWAEVEAGSAHLALGDPSSALEHSERAVELAPLAGQDWVGHEEAYWLQAQVLRALSQVEAADRFERCARETARAKADLIKDPLQRRAFLSRSFRS